MAEKPAPLKETDLFEPIRYYLENQGYKVRSEVKFCDITATRDDELIVIEMKTSFSLALVMQAVRRQEIADSVYVAIPVPRGRDYPPRFKALSKLLKRLELGLILVNFMTRGRKVEVIFHPTPYQPRRNLRFRRSVIREIDDRYRNFNRGGSTSAQDKITAYKQDAIQVAVYLDLLGEASPRELKLRGTGRRTNSILAGNLYGWFDRIAKGHYQLHPAGRQALKKYASIAEHFRAGLKPEK